MKFEVCAVNIQSALAAQAAGAYRIELCSGIDVGGLTPSIGMIRQVVQALEIEVHVLIRPREGDFCYNEAELAIMRDDIRACREAGAQGVVIGALTATGELDLPKMQAMIAAAAGLEVTCHRAFDYTADPAVALEQLITLGIHRVLSSGQAATAYEGRFLLQKVVEQATGRIEIMPGAGISAKNIRTIVETTGAQSFHFTGRTKIVQPSANNAQIPGLEWWYWVSDEQVLREIMSEAERVYI